MISPDTDTAAAQQSAEREAQHGTHEHATSQRAETSSLTPHHVEIREDTPNDTIVPLNVGGLGFMTTLGTLRKYPDSFLGAMFSGRHSNLKRDETGAVFLDRDPMLFGIVLQFLRQGVHARVAM